MAKNQTGVPYVYPHRDKGYKALVWNPHFRALVFLGIFRSIEAAQARAERAMLLLGSVPGKRQPKSTCKRGHVLIGKNVQLKRDGRRKCAICEKDRQREYHLKRKRTRQEQKETT